MRPDPQYPPARAFERLRLPRVPLLVRRNLVVPVLRVRSGTRSMVRAPVPPAPVDPHRQLALREYDIGSDRALPFYPNRIVNSEAEAASVKGRPDGELRSRIPTAIRLHDPPARLGNPVP